MPKPRIFISHSAKHDGRARAFLEDQLRPRLAAEAFEVLLDEKGLEVGDKWEHKIGTWLDRCHAAIVLFTAGTLTSEYVKYEVSNLLHRWRDEAAGAVPFLLLPVLLEPLTEAQLSAFYGRINLWEVQRLEGLDDGALLDALVAKLEPLKAILAADTAEDRLEGHVVAILDKVGDPDFLIGVASDVGIDSGNWGRSDASRRLAQALVSTRLTVTWQAIKAVRPRLGSALTRDLFDLLMPCWVGPQAARALEAVTRHQPPRPRYALLAAQAPEFTPAMYLARAKAQVGDFVGSVISIDSAKLGLKVEADLRSQVKQRLESKLDVNSPESEIPLTIGTALENLEQAGELLLVSVKADAALLPAFVAVATDPEFSGITFLAVMDSPPSGPGVPEVVLPPLPKELEMFAYHQHRAFVKKLNK